MKEQREFYTTEEIKELLQISSMTVYRYIKAGKIKAYKFGKEFRVKNKDLKTFLDNSKYKP